MAKQIASVDGSAEQAVGSTETRAGGGRAEPGSRSPQQGRHLVKSSTQEPPTRRTFSLGPGASQRTLLQHLRPRFPIRRLPRSSSNLSYLDTFDGRIHAGGMRLSLQEEDGGAARLLLELRDGGRSLGMTLEKLPAFASDLPPGPLRRRLRKLAKVRRLVPVVRIELVTSGHAILDDEEKTVARLFFDSAIVRDPEDPERASELPETLCVARIEGYAREFERVLDCLAERRGLTPIQEGLAERALRALGREPARRLSGLEAPLDAEAPCGLAFLTLQRGLFAVMRRNEHGICADLDSEHLHDFRVAVRRSRVLHRIFRDEIAGSGFEALLPGLKWLGRVTGPTRDLDVHLLDMLEEEQAEGAEDGSLRPLVTLLRERRREEWSKLVVALHSPQYTEFVAGATALLDAPDGEATRVVAASGPPLGGWASVQITKAYRRLRKHGRRVEPSSPDDRLHAVRIDGKRLRYLLEFFRGLYEADAIKKLIKELERLQDNLGRFNDACVQRETLRELAHDLDRMGLGHPDTLLAMGRLLERAERRRERERADFEDRFARFEAQQTRRRFRALFAEGARAPRRRVGPGQASGDAIMAPGSESSEETES